MDLLSTLPDYLLLRIFRYLPLKYLVRSGRVNKTTRRISKMVISETQVLELKTGFLGCRRLMSIRSLSATMKLCANNLREISFHGYHANRRLLGLVKAFAGRFRCPNLATFRCELVDDDYGRGEDISESLNTLTRNCPNLTSLIVRGTPGVITSPDFVTGEKLETLCCQIDERGLRSLTGRVPNLKHFTASPLCGGSMAALDRFFSSVPNLETIRIRKSYGLDMEQHYGPTLDALWRLERLEKLEIEDDYPQDEFFTGKSHIGDNVLIRAAQSFPRLRVLSAPTRGITDDGLTALSALSQSLEVVIFDCRYFSQETKDLSAGVRALTKKCHRLRELQFVGIGFGVTVSPNALAEAFHSCPGLTEVHLLDVVGGVVEAPEQAAIFVESLVAMAGGGGMTTTTTEQQKRNNKRVIRITFHTAQGRSRGIWRSKRVNDAVEILDREHGVKVTFWWPNVRDDDCCPLLQVNEDQLWGDDYDDNEDGGDQ